MEEVSSPFIVELHKTYVDKTYVYFLMKYLDGGDFFKIIRNLHKLDKKAVQFYFGCIVNAISKLHSHDIVYRDLKPENIVADRKGYLYLVDLRTVKKLDENNGFKTYTIIGTPQYMAP